MRPVELRAATKQAERRIEERRQRELLLGHVQSSVPRETALVDVDPGGRGIAWKWNVDPPHGVDGAEHVADLVKGAPTRGDYRRVLPAFTLLADSDDNQLLAFVQKFGPLLLCHQHRLPFHHPYEIVPIDEWGEVCGWFSFNTQTEVGETEWYYVLASDIRDWARRFDAITKIAKHLRGDVSAGTELWSQLTPWVEQALRTGHSPAFGFVGDIWRERFFLSVVIDFLVQASGLRLVFRWEGDDRLPQLLLGHNDYWSLAAAVTRELVFECAQIERARFCVNCGEIITGPYSRKYCRKPTCGKAAADRDSKRKQRRKKTQP